MPDRAYIEERTYGDGEVVRKWCLFPCQNPALLHLPAEQRPTCRVAIKPQAMPNGHSWTWDPSTPADAPTLSPSINCQNDACWHGFIVNGEVRNPSRAGG